MDHDGDNDKFQMELTGANSAKLQWLGLPSGFKAQPIPMTRQSAASPKTNENRSGNLIQIIPGT